MKKKKTEGDDLPARRLRRPGYLLLPERRPRDGQRGRTMEYEQDDSPISFLD
jgi:hypothetical protein